MLTKPKLLVSACLLGQSVRHDGGHCRNRKITEVIGQHFELVPICPEVFMGLGTPRQTMHLRKRNSQTFLVNSDGHYLHEEQKKLSKIHDHLPIHEICGAILKKNSPSCALDKIACIDDTGRFLGKREGVYTEILKDTFNIPLIDDGRIHSAELAENFFVHSYALFDFKNIVKKDQDLQKFHGKYKFLLYHYDQQSMRKLGSIAANKSSDNVTVYLSLFNEVMSKGVSKENRLNALYHVFGFFKNELLSDEKKFILKQFELYRNDIVNYMTVLKQLEFLAIKYKNSYLNQQSIFSPFPEGLRVCC